MAKAFKVTRNEKGELCGGVCLVSVYVCGLFVKRGCFVVWLLWQGCENLWNELAEGTVSTDPLVTTPFFFVFFDPKYMGQRERGPRHKSSMRTYHNMEFRKEHRTLDVRSYH